MTGAKRKSRLLLIEDDLALGPLIEEVLSDVYEVERRTDGREGLIVGLDHEFDLMVIDRRLPSIDGLSIVEALRKGRVHAPILLLTALGTTVDRVEGLDSGANDYLVKPFEFDELLARLRALTRTFSDRGDWLPVGTWSFFPDDRLLESPYEGRIALTERESQLLAVLAGEPDRIFTREHLLRVVFADGEQLGTVDTYVHYLRKKTERAIILTVRSRGYRLGAL